MEQLLTGARLQRMHEIQFSLLCELDALCRRHDIPYILEGGTLLGAVRYGHAIPWDDDADVSMLRSDYNRFLEHAKTELPHWCFFQDSSTDPGYPWGYGKLLDTRTKYVRTGQEHLKMRQCVWLDVFPFDGVPAGRLAFTLHDAACFCIRKLLWSGVGALHAKGVWWRAWYGLINHVPKRLVRAWLLGLQKRYPPERAPRVRCLCFPLPKKSRAFHKEWFLKRCEIEYCERRFFAPSDYDGFLRYMFGERYIEEPPKEQKVGGSPGSEIRL